MKYLYLVCGISIGLAIGMQYSNYQWNLVVKDWISISDSWKNEAKKTLDNSNGWEKLYYQCKQTNNLIEANKSSKELKDKKGNTISEHYIQY